MYTGFYNIEGYPYQILVKLE